MSNNPPVMVELTAEQAKFLKENCETNMTFCLDAMMKLGNEMSKDSLVKLVALLENFKGVKAAVEKGEKL